MLFMDLRRSQAAFNESGAINLIRVSNRGGVADGVGYSDRVTQDLRLSIATRHLLLRVGGGQGGRHRAGHPSRSRCDGPLPRHGGVRHPRGRPADRETSSSCSPRKRKPELGVARAVGFLRSDLLTTFALEGTSTRSSRRRLAPWRASASGTSWCTSSTGSFPHGDVAVTFHFDPASVLTAFVAGTALTWVTILLASWR